MKKAVLPLLALTTILASCGQPELPDAATQTQTASTPLNTDVSTTTSPKLTAQYLYVDKARCPDQVSYETQDVNMLARYSCTFLVGGAGAVTTTIVCAASVGWGCFAAGGATAGVLLGCSEIYASKRVTYQVTRTYLADNFYNPPRCFLDRTYKTPLN